MCIVVAESKTNGNWLTVFICSNQPTYKLIADYYPQIKQSGHSYLKHDSHVNCYDPVEFTGGEIEDAAKKPQNKVGRISESELKLFLKLLKACPQIPEGLKKDYL